MAAGLANLAALGYAMVLTCWPGTAGENRYGPPAREKGVRTMKIPQLETTLWDFLFSFQGRSGRLAYLGFGAFCALIISFALLLIYGAFVFLPALALLVAMPVFLALIVASLAVTVRRLHDIGITGWWVLGLCVLCFLQDISVMYIFGGDMGFFVIGAASILHYLAIAALLIWPGTKGPNKYGEPVPFKWREPDDQQ
jgi:uncharacterized membrane protein YhaH (DUF805 family)